MVTAEPMHGLAMAHILFGSPGISQFHLHDRVARVLTARGHRITVLAADPHQEAFYRAQGNTVSALGPVRSRLPHLPTEYFAELDQLLKGQRHPDTASLAAATASLDRVGGSVRRFFENVPVDLLWIHGSRDGLHRMLHFVARESGIPILHTGAGLVPETMQVDPTGLDGDAGAARRTAGDYRDSHQDEQFLSSALAAWLSGARAAPLSRTPVAPIPWTLWLSATCRSLLGRGIPPKEQSWRAALPPSPPGERFRDLQPDGPFVVLVLQDATCPRRLLDGPELSHATLCAASVEAVRALDRHLPLVVLLPPSGLAPKELATLPCGGSTVILRPHQAARALLPTALACITINDPLGASALLCGTPVVHLGRSLYGVAGVVSRCIVDELPRALATAMESGQQVLRGRLLTRLLRDEHVWCSPTEPDHNGLQGLVSRFEQCLSRRGGGGGGNLRYRPGPSWPLSPPIS